MDMRESESHRFLLPSPGMVLDRRSLLMLMGGLASSVLLPGCGGGGSSYPAAPAAAPTLANGGFNLLSASRIEPTGTLRNQIDQFSTAVDDLSLAYSGGSQAVTDLKNFLSTTRSVTRATGAVAGTTTILATQYGIAAAKSLYERTAYVTAMLDQVGYLGDTITKNNGLTGTASVANPQWVAAMMERNYNLLLLAGETMRTFQTFGIGQLGDMVKMQDSSSARLVAYLVAANTFNSWVDASAANVHVAVDPSWKLDVSDAVTADNVANQLDRMRSIALSLPLGPGYLQATTRANLAQSAAGAVQSADTTVLGQFTDNFLNTGVYDGVYTLDRARTVTNIVGSAAPGTLAAGLLKGVGPNLVQSLAVNAVSTGLQLAIPGSTGIAAGCAVQIASQTAQGAEAVGLAVATSETGIGLVVFGGLALWQAYQLGSTIAQCAKDIAAAQADEAKKAAQAYDSTTGDPGNTRNTPAFTNPNRAECDQLGRAGVRPTGVTPLPSDTNPPAKLPPPGNNPDPNDPPLWRKILCGLLSGSTRAQEDVPRTFNNMQIAAAGLILSHGSRNPSTVQAKFNGTTISFYESDLAVLIRRNPGSTSAKIPAIRDADLLCTSPGFLPTRNDAPKDLTNIASLPQLQPNNLEIGTGVQFGVK